MCTVSVKLWFYKLIILHVILLIPPPVGARSTALSLSVCPLAYSGIVHPTITKFPAHVACGRGLIRSGGIVILRYDTIRDAILTWVSLIYRTEPTTKKCKTEKLKRRICPEVTVNSLGNPCSESWRRKRKGCSGKDLQKKKVLSLEWKSEWVMEN